MHNRQPIQEPGGQAGRPAAARRPPFGRGTRGWRWVFVTGAAVGPLVATGPFAGLAGLAGLGAPAANAAARPPAQMSMIMVKVATVPKFGKILVDQAGLALYYNTATKPPSTWWCKGKCLTAWPPLVLGTGQTKPSLGKGVHGISTVVGPSGVQVTWHGKPLYTFIKDKAGTVEGQGIAKVWFVAQLSKGTAPPGSVAY